MLDDIQKQHQPVCLVMWEDPTRHTQVLTSDGAMFTSLSNNRSCDLISVGLLMCMFMWGRNKSVPDLKVINMSPHTSWQSVSAGRLWGSRHPAVQPPTGLWPGRLRLRGHERQGSASRLGPDPWLWWQHNLLGKFDSAKVTFVVMSQLLSVS